MVGGPAGRKINAKVDDPRLRLGQMQWLRTVVPNDSVTQVLLRECQDYAARAEYTSVKIVATYLPSLQQRSPPLPFFRVNDRA